MLGRELEPGTFRENLTVPDTFGTEACVGDVFCIGGAVAQVSQRQMPCGKLAGKNGEKLLTRWVAQTGYARFYVRVLSEGSVTAGTTFECVMQHPGRSSRAVAGPRAHQTTAGLPEFAADGRAHFARHAKSLLQRVPDGQRAVMRSVP